MVLGQASNGDVSVFAIAYLNVTSLLRFRELFDGSYLPPEDSAGQAQVEVVVIATVALASMVLPVASLSAQARHLPSVAGPAMSVGCSSFHFAIMAIEIHLVLHNFGLYERTQMTSVISALLAMI